MQEEEPYTEAQRHKDLSALVSLCEALKTELRKSIKARLATLTPETLSAAGVAAARYLEQIPRWENFSSVLAFVSMKDEIDTCPIMEAAQKAGKTLFAPRVDGETMTFYPIDPPYNPPRNPRLPSASIRGPLLVFTPGLAFDRRLHRLGRGRGYYDRFFAAFDAAEQQYTAVGLCLDCQIVDEVPVCPWDKNMDLLLTESGVHC